LKKWTILVLASMLVIGSFGITQQAFAFPVSVTSSDDPNCDPLSAVPPDVDELGKLVFAPDELITVFDLGPAIFHACPAGVGLSILMEITNTVSPPRAFTDVWYVANAGTTIANFDGFVDGGSGPLPAFRIDSTGINLSLISESATFDGIFEPGETWNFVIDDYAAALSPSSIGSLGVPDSDAVASASIIAIADEGPPVGGTSIPLDTTALLVAGAQTTTPWLILGVLSAVGIGLAVITLRKH